MSFLTAEWRKLAIANYAVPPSLLKPHVPLYTELDAWEGTCYVSLVGFMFLNTRLLGVGIPFHRNFEEVNLRFYVRYKDGGEWKRGVVFLREIVPRAALTLVANTVYGEHYQTMKMAHTWGETDYERQVAYRWWNAGGTHSFSVTANKEARPILAGSEAEFITEHYWGYTRVNAEKTFEYEVRHPRWDCYPVREYRIEVDFGRLYGDEFGELSGRRPDSVMLAEGSEVSVEGKRRIGPGG